MGLGEHPEYVVDMCAVTRKEGELDREQHLAGDPQWLAVGQVVQRRGDSAFDRVLNRHQGGSDVAVADSLQGEAYSRVRRRLVGQCGQRKQRLVGESSDRSEVAVVVRRDCEHRLRLSLPYPTVGPFLTRNMRRPLVWIPRCVGR